MAPREHGCQQGAPMRRIIDLSNSDAKAFFLKGTSYFSLELPPYFEFDALLQKIDNNLINGNLSDYYNNKDRPHRHNNTNHIFVFNKDGCYSWRKFQIIHPALYIDLVNLITKKENWEYIKTKFRCFEQNSEIICCSHVCESNSKNRDTGAAIQEWWTSFEQRSIFLAMQFNHMASTDIVDCYGSIYTHSISWALHTKPYAKTHSNKSRKRYIGDRIDSAIQSMSYKQTNGIPQGSLLMDFVAEIILSYADTVITANLKNSKITNYKILRYRDDYRIFANTDSAIASILKIISESLMELNFKLSPQKTRTSPDIITNAIKPDKLDLLTINIASAKTLQKKLLLIYQFSIKNPNSGSLRRLLKTIYSSDIFPLKQTPPDIMQLISITVEIMYKNTKTYLECTAMLSVLFNLLSNQKIKNVTYRIKEKFKQIPNTEYLELWLQRITLLYDKNIDYESHLCQKVYLAESPPLWNSSWLTLDIDENIIINQQELTKLSKTIDPKSLIIFDPPSFV